MTARDHDTGGDPVCWLDRVCPECGLFLEDADEPCPRCGRTGDTGLTDPLPSRR
ncbi:hypothetical protein ACWDTG_10090 [Rhodococcus zopfii]|uniref:hypothetical protein n=1 Tax=Rhodococcus zopfii TaxID=43772 RepID=UPI001486A7AA|nr:hypothetical protein [Rhodococcus zopfii]